MGFCSCTGDGGACVCLATRTALHGEYRAVVLVVEN